MGSLITGGAGLLLGITLLIWALRERGRRADAEQAVVNVKAALDRADIAAAANAQIAKTMENRLHAADLVTSQLRNQLNEVRERLAQSGDPKAVKAWLDSELKDETV